MSELIFYSNPKSRSGVVRWMLEELGITYETVTLEYGAPMKSPDYLAINPMGKVPAILHRGRVVTECAAICLYLADAFPDAGLAPALADRHAYYRWIAFAAGPLEQAVMDRFRKVELDAEQQVMAGYGSWDRVITTAKKALTGVEWIAGERFSAADVYFGRQIDWFVQFGIVENHTPFREYVERLRARPAYQRANAG